jgi:DNA-binding CsgD family transcriptional regulator
MKSYQSLSEREVEVLYWICLGKTNSEIAMILNISMYTVKNHVKNILKRMSANNRTHAAKSAIMEGILKDKAA